jgi:glycerol-3-phosphate cytidylyltransferase
MLEDAKRQCDYLIAALQLDPLLFDRPEKTDRPNRLQRYIQPLR